ncbi:sigma-54-dependent Fis family transcriptional regulator [Steroidobacter sp.]|uniref:sigma-54-dependent Fis family transcriptional regulator n=1 Tax=Steroidobacter sp. TaxID=1978227 RepID=UPI001A604B10|nr:sigma-54-dependent Fis family transcriptional regulator [Steroidobacter sp.]MBL8270050.1 sigma-54-dependent Fis family transcriptional regulator [Steroidobacter sp.]
MDATAVHAGNVLEFVLEPKASTPGPPLTLHPAIAGSWRRCAIDYSLDPGRRTFSPTVIDAAVLAERLVQHADLLQIAAAEIDWLYEHIAGSGYALVLTDAAGIVLYEKTDATLVDVFRSAGLTIGADWSERQEGTNGIGTCIAENRPVIVYREEHFRSCHIGLSCSGAPIRDPSGKLLAVLDASTLNARDTRASLAHTMALVSLSAQLIEKCLFLQHFQSETVFRFHARPEFVNLQHSGAIAVANDGSVVAVDETALWLLRAKNRAALVGRGIEEIFDVSAAELIEPDYRGQTSLRPVRDMQFGRHFFLSLDQETGTGRTAVIANTSREILQLAPAISRKACLTLEDLAGEDPQMGRNIRSARRIASSRVPVMIQGATGAGKEMFARALHTASDRAARPFVALNCAAIPETLIESELFGYAPGAFTGARKSGMKGKILQSSGGTLFLDEIGDMQLSLQTRLLRVLEEQEVMPLGTDTPIQVDLRVMCASHQNLRAMIARGTFREDLYYRLNGITIELPSLAQRADKERLIREFFATESCDGRPVSIEMDAFQRLLDYSWPGNVRELRNVIRTILAICDSDVIRMVDLPSEVRLCQSRCDDGVDATPSIERDALVQCIRDCDGNMSRAAERLGVSRNTLYRRCKRLDIPLQHSRGGII